MRQTICSVDGLMVRGVADGHPLDSDCGWSTTLPTLRVTRLSGEPMPREEDEAMMSDAAVTHLSDL